MWNRLSLIPEHKHIRWNKKCNSVNCACLNGLNLEIMSTYQKMSLQATRDTQVEETAAIIVELIPNYNLFVCH